MILMCSLHIYCTSTVFCISKTLSCFQLLKCLDWFLETCAFYSDLLGHVNPSLKWCLVPNWCGKELITWSDCKRLVIAINFCVPRPKHMPCFLHRLFIIHSFFFFSLQDNDHWGERQARLNYHSPSHTSP